MTMKLEFRIAIIAVLFLIIFNVGWSYAASPITMDESGTYVNGDSKGTQATELMVTAMNTTLDDGILASANVEISMASLVRYGITIAGFLVVVVCIAVGLNSVRSAKYVY